jgi:hypothetical protein
LDYKALQNHQTDNNLEIRGPCFNASKDPNVFISMLPLSEGLASEAWEPSIKMMLFLFTPMTFPFTCYSAMPACPSLSILERKIPLFQFGEYSRPDSQLTTLRFIKVFNQTVQTNTGTEI